MEKIILNDCKNCPFMVYEYDDFSIGDPETYSCNLLRKRWKDDISTDNIYKPINFFIKLYKNGNIKSKNKKTLDNCPLLENEIIIKLNIKKECCGNCKCDEKKNIK